MPGSKISLGDGKYRLFVSNGFRADGKANRATKIVRASSDRAAEKMLQEFYLAFAKKPVRVGGTILFKDFIKIWLEKHERKLSPNTQHSDRSIVKNRLLPYFGRMKLNKITETHIMLFFDDLAANPERMDKKQGDLSKGSIYSYYRVLRCLLNKAVAWGYLGYNPCNNIPVEDRPKKVYAKPPILENAELKAFLQALFSLRDTATNTKHKLFLYLSLIDACRSGEHIALRWDDIDWKNRRITIRHGIYEEKGRTYAKSTKNELVRVVFFDELAETLFRQHQKNQTKWLKKNNISNPMQYVFLKARTNEAQMPTRSSFWHWLDSFLKKNNIRHIGVHGFRRMAASYALGNNVPLTVVKEMMGHADISTTNIYLRNLQDRQRKSMDTMSIVFNNMIDDNKE